MSILTSWPPRLRFSVHCDKVKQTAGPWQHRSGFCGVLIGWQLASRARPLGLRVEWSANKHRCIHFHNLLIFPPKNHELPELYWPWTLGFTRRKERPPLWSEQWGFLIQVWKDHFIQQECKLDITWSSSTTVFSHTREGMQRVTCWPSFCVCEQKLLKKLLDGTITGFTGGGYCIQHLDLIEFGNQWCQYWWNDRHCSGVQGHCQLDAPFLVNFTTCWPIITTVAKIPGYCFHPCPCVCVFVCVCVCEKKESEKDLVNE